jgi:glycosyltransferase involved in cell wall biosynthesis
VDSIYEIAFSILKNRHELLSLKYGEAYFEKNSDDVRFSRTLKRRIFNIEGDRIGEDGSIYDITKENLILLFAGRSENEIEDIIKNLLLNSPNKESKIYELLFAIYKDSNRAFAVKYGMRYFRKNPFDLKFISILQKRVKELELKDELKEIDDNKKEYIYFKKLTQGELFNSDEFNKYLFIEQLKVISKKMRDIYIQEYIRVLQIRYSDSKDTIYEVAFSILKDSHERLALQYGKKHLEIDKIDSRFKRIFSRRVFDFNLKNREQIAQEGEEKYLLELKNNKLFSKSKVNLKLFKMELSLIANTFSENSIDTIVKYVYSKFPKQQDKISEIIFSILKDTHIYIAIEYGKKYIMQHSPNDSKFARVLVNRMGRVDLIDEMIVIAKKVLEYGDDSVLRNIIFQNEMKIEINILEDLYKNKEFEKIDKKILLFKREYSSSKSLLYRLLHEFYMKKDYKISENYALKSLSIKDNEFVRKSLYDLHIYYGSISKALSVIPDDVQDNTLRIKKLNGTSLFNLLKNGFDLPIDDFSLDYTPIKNKVFYLLHNRLPYNSGGYATRSHGLLTNVSSFGWDINGVSRLGYPWDKMPNKESNKSDIIDNIKYYRLLNGKIGLGKLPMREYLEEYAKELLKKVKEERPNIIHAASNHMNGLVGNYVAKSVGIKSVYEVRGLWEITRISRQPEWKNTEYYELMVNLEAEAARGADKVLTLTEALKDEMIARGVNGDKIEILPNGVTSNRFQPLDRDSKLEDNLGLKDKVIIGYIGSVVAYEGLEYLVDSIEILIKKGISNIAVLIVGDGAVLDMVKNRVESKELNDYFIFTGRVPHEEVERYYSLVDITPFPRKGQPVCEMVSPLKPFEAMAMEKAVISSNVAALEEIVTDGYNGILFQKDSVEDLADKLEILIDDKELRVKLGKQSREWVIEQRDWRVISEKLANVYSYLVN